MTYTVARELGQALDLIQDGTAVLVAGGTDFFPAKVKGKPTPHIVDVSRVGELHGISKTPQGWRIGGAATWTDILHAPLPAAFDGLKQAAREVGSVQIQNAATVAGNLCNASPAADSVPPFLTLDASVELCSVGGPRILPLGEFLLGVRKTALRRGEILTGVLVPEQPDHVTGAFEKLGSRRYLVISIAMVAAVVGVDASGQIDFARLAVGACSPVAKRQFGIEADLIGQRPLDVVVLPAQLEGLSPIEDSRSDANFRLLAAAAQLTRALHKGAAI